jgi:hypothetical protein
MKKDELRYIRHVLYDLEWCETPERDDGNNKDYCPKCHNHRKEGHEEDCEMSSAISFLDKALAGKHPPQQGETS